MTCVRVPADIRLPLKAFLVPKVDLLDPNGPNVFAPGS
jgi:hypothetical protein